MLKISYGLILILTALGIIDFVIHSASKVKLTAVPEYLHGNWVNIDGDELRVSHGTVLIIGAEGAANRQCDAAEVLGRRVGNFLLYKLDPMHAVSVRCSSNSKVDYVTLSYADSFSSRANFLNATYTNHFGEHELGVYLK